MCCGERWRRGKETVYAGFVGGNKRSVGVGGCGVAVHAQNVRRNTTIYRKEILINNKTKKARKLIIKQRCRCFGIEGIALGHAVRHSQESHVLRDFLGVEVDDGLIVGHDVARDRCEVG